MTELRPGWIRTTLGEVVARPRAKASPADYPELPFVGMDHIASNGMTLLGTVKFGDMKSNGGLFLEGDVLYGRMRPYLNKVYRAKFAGACSAEFIVFPRCDAIDSDFLAYLLHDSKFVTFASRLSSGDRPRVDLSDISSYSFNLPPREEQTRIASTIAELFSRIDQGEQTFQRAVALVEHYRVSVLKAAVTGELTREWREKNKNKVEPSEVLLARILKARREAWEKDEMEKMREKGLAPRNDTWKEKYPQPAGPEITDLPELPCGWTWVSIGQACFVGTGATPKRGTDRYYNGGTVPWVTSSAVNERLVLQPTEFITPAAIEETNAKVFPAGSLLIALYGEGKTRGKISELAIDAATNQACAALLCGHLDPCLKPYIRSFFEKNYETLRQEAAGGVQPNLNLSILKATPLPLPPREEIEEINQRISKRQSQLAALVTEFSRWQHRSAALRQSVLRSAFNGKLVRQDPEDESVALLRPRNTSTLGPVNGTVPPSQKTASS
ncbi:MAG TPA: restriction endonuclease subunit S [Gemmatimonadaceae bacterium]|nr:restriction endonuclease subunit S [Gemmatimonadaceae bacterium]